MVSIPIIMEWRHFPLYMWAFPERNCGHNTSKDPFSRWKNVQQLATEKNWRSQNTVWLQVHNWIIISRRKEICTWYCVCVVKPSTTPMTTWLTIKGIAFARWNRARHQWQRDHEDPEHFQHSAHEHWHVTAQFSCLLVRFVSSWFTLLRMAQGCCSCHLIHAWDERFSSTLSPPFSSTSSSSRSSFISCTSSRTSSTSLRAVAGLCTPPKRVWTLWTTPTPSHWIHPFGCDASPSVGRVYSRQATARNCENSAVSFVMKYCPISKTFRNPASLQNLLNLSFCDSFSILRKITRTTKWSKLYERF